MKKLILIPLIFLSLLSFGQSGVSMPGISSPRHSLPLLTYRYWAGSFHIVTDKDSTAILISSATSPAVMASNGPVILSIVTGVNTKIAASTPLYTVPSGKTLVIMEVRVKCTAATAITAAAQASVGVAAGSVYTTASIGVTNSTQGYAYPTGGVMTPPTAGQVLNFTVDTPATGTSQTVTVILVGYLI